MPTQSRANAFPAAAPLSSVPVPYSISHAREWEVRDLELKGVVVPGARSPQRRAELDREVYNSDNWVLQTAYEDIQAVNRHFGVTTRYRELEPAALRAQRDQQDALLFISELALAGASGIRSVGTALRVAEASRAAEVVRAAEGARLAPTQVVRSAATTTSGTSELITVGRGLVGDVGAASRVGVPIPPTAGGASGPLFRTWNQFQSGTKGQFANRTEAAAAWQVYKDANGIVVGTVRNETVNRGFLRSLVDDYRTPSSMKPWLEQGRRPPGYEIDHIRPLSIGGQNVPSNMRLQGTDLHRLHHQYYHPWTW